MTVFETPFYECMMYTLCVYGVYLLFRHLKFPDISTDNVFSLGSISFAYFIIYTQSFFIACCLSITIGFLTGCFTALLYQKLRIPQLLAGILTYAMLFSINLKFFKRPNVSIPGDLIRIDETMVLLIVNILLVLFMYVLYKSKLGKSISTFGNNPAILKEFNAPSTVVLLLGCGLANSFITLSGGLTSFYFGFSDVGFGTGLLVNSVAAIIISENLMQYVPRAIKFLAIPVGVFLYHLSLYVVITYFSFGFLDFTDYKLISGAIIIMFFLFSNKKTKKIISF